MIHIATVHWNTDKWINIQKSYLEKHLTSPYRVYAWLNNVSPVSSNTFYYTCSEPIADHAIKLNIMADIIYFSSNRDDDILIFLDGDAFPIADLEPYLRQKLSDYKLIAVQRLDNNGDIQPHPSFCATTISFWRAIRGDWKAGYRWQNQTGNWTTDVGGNLLKLLEDGGVRWHPLVRSNTHSPHLRWTPLSRPRSGENK